MNTESSSWNFTTLIDVSVLAVNTQDELGSNPNCSQRQSVNMNRGCTPELFETVQVYSPVSPVSEELGIEI